MSDDVAIKVSNVSKTFILPHEKQNSIKSLFVNFYKRKKTYEKQQVLNDISFEVKKGEFFGIVGRNGSGKSTLLKLISQIYTPDKGEIKVNGKLTPFIELGVGFNPELSGRENVFLNGALLGFSHKEMEAMYDEIVEFAELERFMDQKLKNYSSGMQVRLAFSIAIRANSDILVLDEVLAVGDEAFQMKCNDYFARIKNANKTVILVTHDMASVEKYCDKAIVLNGGSIAFEGDTMTATKKYNSLNIETQAKRITKEKNNRIVSDQCSVVADIRIDNKPTAIVSQKDSNIELQCVLSSDTNVNNVVLGVIISNGANTPIFAANTKVLDAKIDLKKGKKTTVTMIIDNIFANGEYTVATGIKSYDQSRVFYANANSANFVVGDRKHSYALASPRHTIEVS